VARNATTNEQLSRDQQRLQRDASDSKIEHNLCYRRLAIVNCRVIRRRIGSSAPLPSTCRPPSRVLHPSPLFDVHCSIAPRRPLLPCLIAPRHLLSPLVVSSPAPSPCKVSSAPLLLLCRLPRNCLEVPTTHSSHVPPPPSCRVVRRPLASCRPPPPLVVSSTARSPLTYSTSI
jgi:hypothetical protein